MTIADLFVIYKPSDQTDSMGGDLPWQSYSYATPERSFSSELSRALIFTSKEEAERYKQEFTISLYRYRVAPQLLAHQNEMQSATDQATYYMK